MILKRYGETVQSVELNFDSRAMTEIGFRRDRKLSMPSEEFAERYEAVETLEFTADADGAVQDEAERAVLSALEEQVRALEGKLDESQVILIESAQGVDYPKTRDRKRNEARDGEIRAHFHWTIDPPLRVGVYRANTCEPGPRSRMRTPLGHAALGVLVLGVATCTFERRPDRAPDTDPANGTRQTATADSVIAVVGGFHDAVERGDLARAASYLDEDAEVYDRSLGRMGVPALEALDHAAVWSAGSVGGPTSVTTTVLGETVLVVAEFAQAGPDSDRSGASFETLVLVRGAGGWTIRHLHRSDGPGS